MSVKDILGFVKQDEDCLSGWVVQGCYKPACFRWQGVFFDVAHSFRMPSRYKSIYT